MCFRLWGFRFTWNPNYLQFGVVSPQLWFIEATGGVYGAEFRFSWRTASAALFKQLTAP